MIKEKEKIQNLIETAVQLDKTSLWIVLSTASALLARQELDNVEKVDCMEVTRCQK